MASSDPFIPTYGTCDEVSPQCPIEATIYGTELSFGAAVFFALAFGALLLFQIYFGLRGRTWSFMFWLGLGTGFEALGYVARTRLAQNAWSLDNFVVQYLTLLLAPTLVAAAISVLCKHLVIWYGPQWSVIRPTLYPWVFVGTDLISITVQIIGGGAMAASTAGEGGKTAARIGEVLVVGGVAFQVANMLFCGGLMWMYARRRSSSAKGGVALLENDDPYGGHPVDVFNLRGREVAMSRASATEPEAKKVRMFMIAMSVGYVAILVRCAYRISENIPALAIKVLRNEPLFLALDGGMILLAIGAATIFHPYMFFPFLSVKSHDREAHAQNAAVLMQARR